MNSQLPLLLISADAGTRTKLKNYINKLQLFNVDVAFDSKDAIEKLRHNPYQFIISDINIGDVDAWCLSSLIRSDIYKCDKKTPIVLLADTHSERIAEATAKSFGINSVLAKSDSARVNEILADAFSTSLPLRDRLNGLTIISTPENTTDFEALLQEKFYIESTYSGKDGLALIRQKEFDFVIIDSELEHEAAMPLMQTIHFEMPSLPIVILVSKNNYACAEHFVLNGASDFIYIPFNASRVINICERAARRNDFMISNKQFTGKVNQLEKSEKKFKALSNEHTQLLENLSSVVMELDETGHIRFLNNAWKTLTGFSISQSLGRNIMDFIDTDELGVTKFSNQLNNLLMQATSSSTEEVRVLNAQGKSVWVEIKFHQLIKNKQARGLAATIDNIDDRKIAEEKLQHLALHDTLTGLNNRYFFDNELNRLTMLASRGKTTHSLLYIDLDHFKIINDTEGHQMGDLVLKEVALLLEKRIRQSDILCRVGGDEFVILLAETELQQAMTIGKSICNQIAEAHFQFGNNSYKISASIGAAEIDGNASAAEYLRRADIALYVAKNKGRNRTHGYSETDTDTKQQHDNMQWAHRLQEAVLNDGIILHFQPIWDLTTDEVAYYEALVRLNINGELIYPNDFISALERTEDINLLDHQVVHQAIKLVSQHPELHKIAINLSAQAFSDEGLLPLIQKELKNHNVNGAKIIFELTESASLTNVSATRRMIQQLQQLGCQFSIDDFGTGFSTFAYLRELPAESVKIDGSFVKDMATNSVDRSLVSAIINVANTLGKVCVAEFVEDKITFDELRKSGAEFAQGYYISRPLRVDQIKDFKFTP